MSGPEPEFPAYLRLVRADNPGPMTLDGTNTWIVGDPDAGPVVVVDPGPALPEHLEAVVAATGGEVSAVVLTHRHADHAEAAPELSRRLGCEVRAVDPAYRSGAAGLADGDLIEVGGAGLEVVATPGHTSDSCCLLLSGVDGRVRLLTGDTVLGRGTTVITHPDGDLGAYFASLQRLQEVVDRSRVEQLLPGHGPVVDDPAAVLEAYRAHRLERLDQVRSALAAGDRTASEVVARVYADVDPSVWPAAEQSVRAQLDYLDAG